MARRSRAETGTPSRSRETAWKGKDTGPGAGAVWSQLTPGQIAVKGIIGACTKGVVCSFAAIPSGGSHATFAGAFPGLLRPFGRGLSAPFRAFPSAPFCTLLHPSAPVLGPPFCAFLRCLGGPFCGILRAFCSVPSAPSAPGVLSAFLRLYEGGK